MPITFVFILKNESDELRAYVNLEKKWGMVARNGKCYHVGLEGAEDIIDYAIEFENMKVKKVYSYEEHEKLLFKGNKHVSNI